LGSRQVQGSRWLGWLPSALAKRDNVWECSIAVLMAAAMPTPPEPALAVH